MQVPYYYSQIKLRVVESTGVVKFVEFYILVASTNEALLASIPASDELRQKVLAEPHALCYSACDANDCTNPPGNPMPSGSITWGLCMGAELLLNPKYTYPCYCG